MLREARTNAPLKLKLFFCVVLTVLVPRPTVVAAASFSIPLVVVSTSDQKPRGRRENRWRPAGKLFCRKNREHGERQPSRGGVKVADRARRCLVATAGVWTAAAAARHTPFAVLLAPDKSYAVAATVNDARREREDFPAITHRVFFDVRMSRSDGSFYVRDDLPDLPENKVFAGRIVLGLFGTAAPSHVSEFLKYVNVGYDPLDDNPLPSYSRSTFTRLDQSTGLLEGGYIPGLEVTSMGGAAAIRYGGRVLPAPLWIEKGTGVGGAGDYKKISHGTGGGLVTHRSLDASPSFGITTRSAGPELDPTHVVFGRVLPDEESREFLRRCEDIPTYSLDRPASSPPPPGGGGGGGDGGSRATEELASKVFSTQRDFFRGAAKTFGDSRLDKVYEGKLLRRVEVTKVGLL